MLVAGRVQQAANPRGQFSNPGGGNVPNPVAPPPQPTDYTRPIYPWPMVAKYSGKGDVSDAASYVAVKGPAQTPQTFHAQTMKLLGPDNQKFYRAENGELLEVKGR